jgi:hypothetical protein
MPENYREAVAEFIRTKGITRCPTACVLPTQGLVPTADRVVLEEHAFAERGLDLSYESVRSWVFKFGPAIARGLRRCRPRPSDRWHLDGVSRTHLRRMKVWSCMRDEGGPLDAHHHRS